MQYSSLDCSVILDQTSPISSLTLLCPITRTRQTVPVRTDNCNHVETFDLYNFISSFSYNDILMKEFIKPLLLYSSQTVQKVVHQCPLCKCKGRLYIDSYVLSALTLFPSDVISVNVTSSGLLTAASPDKDQAENHSFIDLVTPSHSLAPPQVACSPVSTPDPFCLPKEPLGISKTGFVRRTFSFGDSCLSGGYGVGRERYTRLSTVDLTSPC